MSTDLRQIPDNVFNKYVTIRADGQIQQQQNLHDKLLLSLDYTKLPPKSA